MLYSLQPSSTRTLQAPSQRYYSFNINHLFLKRKRHAPLSSTITSRWHGTCAICWHWRAVELPGLDTK
ncbi:hypothetical protein [Pseudomonas sp. MGal98]|uniref:hypothetical protein n=1 Tax=Pseudomonas sp. MGal98 TaxID=3162460 RepID=UPI0032EB42CF